MNEKREFSANSRFYIAYELQKSCLQEENMKITFCKYFVYLYLSIYM